ncbi:hypothetical protein [Anabaena azotica]|uniref:Uncharacterized protein n=1 Tax=Anabaena azotica FACHB-119 TaxID=947527 RepID=A0ABR8D9J4_9NOST|nr:hypothetical protein [Anabaena azotica]MBD2502418.1 hypothetical protein [Anabaena azotica FACHB-119]
MFKKTLYKITKASADLFCQLLGQPSVSELKAQLHDKNIQIQKLEEQEKALYRVMQNP